VILEHIFNFIFASKESFARNELLCLRKIN